MYDNILFSAAHVYHTYFVSNMAWQFAFVSYRFSGFGYKFINGYNNLQLLLYFQAAKRI